MIASDAFLLIIILRLVPLSNMDPLKKTPMGRSWQCQEPGCGKITIKPYRWVVGAKTTFACDSCNGKVMEVGALESTPILEDVLRKMALLEQQLMALKHRMDDQCGKP